jgi:hypothetical protein
MEGEQLQDFLNAANELFDHRLASILEVQNSEIVRLREEVSRLQGQARRLELRMADLEAALRMRRARAEPTMTEAGYVHFELADEYHFIVEQSLVGIVDKWFERQAADNQDRRAAEAGLISKLTTLLFGESDIDHERVAAVFADPAVDAADIQRICDRVARLRAKVANAGSQSWDFNFRRGKRLDPERQTAWPGCVGDGLVRFVVAPSYVALNKIFFNQLVFTSEVPVKNSRLRWLFRPC